MPADQKAPRRAPVGAVSLFVLACLLYILIIAMIADSAHTDAAGRGMAQGFAAIFAIALWGVLAGLMLIAHINGRMPAWVAGAAVILIPLSYFTALNAIGFDNREVAWPKLMAAMLPPVIAF